MKTYFVTVKEILRRSVEVKAENSEEAKEKVLDMYRNAEIVLDAEDYVETKIYV